MVTTPAARSADVEVGLQGVRQLRDATFPDSQTRRLTGLRPPRFPSRTALVLSDAACRYNIYWGYATCNPH